MISSCNRVSRIMAISAFILGACVLTFAADKPATPAAEGSFFLQPNDVVLFLGDSITAETRYYWKIFYTDIARQYPDLGTQQDKAPDFKGAKLTFINAGVSGEESGGGKNRLPGLLTDKKPTVVVICFGMNDSLHGNPGGYKDNMRAMVKAAKEAKCAVTILSSPTVCTVGHPDKEPHVKTLGDLRDQAKAIAAEEGVLFSDCYEPMKKYMEEQKKDFTWGDGIHPNNEGHGMMAEALEATWGFGKPLAKQGAPRPGVKAVVAPKAGDAKAPAAKPPAKAK